MDKYTATWIKEQREKIYDNDRALIAAMNRRLKLVKQMADFKKKNGIPILDAERETVQTGLQVRANNGPLSEDALRALYRIVLNMTKQELDVR